MLDLSLISPSAHGGVKPHLKCPPQLLGLDVAKFLPTAMHTEKRGYLLPIRKHLEDTPAWFLKRCIPFSVTFVAGYALKLIKRGGGGGGRFQKVPPSLFPP